MNSEPIEMVEMETRLREDASGAYRDLVTTTLRSALQRATERVRSGLAPDEYARAQALCAGLQTAIQVVEKVWRLHHSVR